MDIKKYDDTPGFVSSFQASNKLDKVDLDNPMELALGTEASVPALIQSFIHCQAQTSNTLIELLGQKVTGNVTINDKQYDETGQKDYLSKLASRQNLLSRQLEHQLHQHVQLQKGIDSREELHLINEAPKEFGSEEKVSDSGLRLIDTFSGDTSQNETALNKFFKDIFALAQTSNLNEQTVISVILRKLSGSATILIDEYVKQNGGIKNVKLSQIVSHLERKFLTTFSPLNAAAQLHSLQQQGMTYSQLQATCQRLSRLSCRLEPEASKEALIRVKENTGFLMALNQADRLFINTENVRRASNSLAPLTLDMMADALITHNADKLAFKDHQVFMAQEIDQQEFPVGQVQQYKQRGNGRYNYNNRGRNVETPHVTRQDQGQEIQPPLLRGNGQRRGNYRGSRNYQNNNRRQNVQRRYQRVPFITTEMANVEKHACIMCGSKDHQMKDSRCPYKDDPKMPSPCKHCLVGCHPHMRCQVAPRNQNDFWPSNRM